MATSFLPLWTNWQPGPIPAFSTGTPSSAVCSRSLLSRSTALSGSRSKPPVSWQRARQSSPRSGFNALVLTMVSLMGHHGRAPGQAWTTTSIIPETFVIPVGVAASMAGIWLFNRNAQPVKAFLFSCLYLFFMLAGACWGLYPTLLPATTGAGPRHHPGQSAISGPHTLAVGWPGGASECFWPSATSSSYIRKFPRQS
jgi:hypothetical protein